MEELRLTEKSVNYTIEDNKVVCEVEFEFSTEPIDNAIAYNHRAINIVRGNVTNNKLTRYKGHMQYRTKIVAKGIAICSPNDTFDENLGKKIAHSKAIIKGYNKYKKILSVSQSSLYDKSVNMYNNIKRIEKITKREKKHLSNLVNS